MLHQVAQRQRGEGIGGIGGLLVPGDGGGVVGQVGQFGAFVELAEIVGGAGVAVAGSAQQPGFRGDGVAVGAEALEVHQPGIGGGAGQAGNGGPAVEGERCRVVLLDALAIVVGEGQAVHRGSEAKGSRLIEQLVAARPVARHMLADDQEIAVDGLGEGDATVRRLLQQGQGVGVVLGGLVDAAEPCLELQRVRGHLEGRLAGGSGGGNIDIGAVAADAGVARLVLAGGGAGASVVGVGRKDRSGHADEAGGQCQIGELHRCGSLSLRRG